MPDVKYAELKDASAAVWARLSYDDQRPLRHLRFVQSVRGHRIYFLPGFGLQQVQNPLERIVKRLTRAVDVVYHHETEPAEQRLVRSLKDPGQFRSVRFGSDVAEQDDDLLHYFVSTPAYRRACSGEKCIIIGPKGSGKSAILRALTDRAGAQYSVVITPDVFATSVLAQFFEDSRGMWDEDEAFVSTWIFTILVEVFKQVCDNPRGAKTKALQRIREFLRTNAQYKDVDLFTRFMVHLKRIYAIKIGEYELTIKAKKLQELYALQEVYSLVPELKKAMRGDVLVLIDELDQGWDNSAHSNTFVRSLMQAALKIQNMGLRAHVMVFVRSEIFDLIKHELDQLDKLRSGIETISWNDSQLVGLVFRRVGFSCGIQVADFDAALLEETFAESYHGVPGLEYLISRTTRRPREVLQIVRQAHQTAVEDKAQRVGRLHIERAEQEFSNWKREHLCSEYKYILPQLDDVLGAFRGHGPPLARAEVVDIIEELQLMAEDVPLPAWAMAVVPEIIQKLYDIEFLGIERTRTKKSTHSILGRFEFAYDRATLNVKREEHFIVHPAFWATLELEPM